MPFDWTQFLDLARLLKAQADTGSLPADATYRCAVGRAYYAAFGYALRYAVRWLGFRAKGGSLDDHAQNHGALRAHLNQKKRQAAARRLGDLRYRRNDCDYQDTLVDVNLRDWAEQAIVDAAYIIQSLPEPTERR